MTTPPLMTALSNLSARRQDRLQLTQQVIDNNQIEALLSICFQVQSPSHIKAWWIMEWVLASDKTYLETYGPTILRRMDVIEDASALRPLVKILCMWTKSQIKGNTISIQQQDMNALIKGSFDWLISDTKVAIKVHSMELLSLIMKWNDWIIEPLSDILYNNIEFHSPAYKSKALKILRKIKNHT